ncbi:hypothetical protein [Streptomyces sp. NPDC002851]
MVILAALTALGGLIALLAGAYGLHRTRRTITSGHVADALVKPPQPGSRRPLLQFEAVDGRVVEIVSPVPASRRAPLAAGSSVMVAYDALDPRETVVLGRERTRLDLGFVTAGAALVALGALLAVRYG